MMESVVVLNAWFFKSFAQLICLNLWLFLWLLFLIKKCITTIKKMSILYTFHVWLCYCEYVGECSQSSKRNFMHLLSFILLSKRLLQFWIRDETLENVAEVRLNSFKPWFLCEYIFLIIVIGPFSFNSDIIISLQRSPSETLRASSQWRHESDESSWLQSGQDSDRTIAEVVETIGGEWHHLARVFSCICLIITISIKSSYFLLSWREHWVHRSSFECSEHCCCW